MTGQTSVYLLEIPTHVGMPFLLAFAWVACAAILVRSLSALNESPARVKGLWPNIYKLLLLTEAGGSFCVLASPLYTPLVAVIGAAIVLVSVGILAALRLFVGWIADVSSLFDDAFNVEL